MKCDKEYKGIFSISAKGYLKSNNIKKLTDDIAKKLVKTSVENYNSKFDHGVIINLFNIPPEQHMKVYQNEFIILCTDYYFDKENLTMELQLVFTR